MDKSIGYSAAVAFFIGGVALVLPSPNQVVGYAMMAVGAVLSISTFMSPANARVVLKKWINRRLKALALMREEAKNTQNPVMTLERVDAWKKGTANILIGSLGVTEAELFLAQKARGTAPISPNAVGGKTDFAHDVINWDTQGQKEYLEALILNLPAKTILPNWDMSGA